MNFLIEKEIANNCIYKNNMAHNSYESVKFNLKKKIFVEYIYIFILQFVFFSLTKYRRDIIITYEEVSYV